MRSITLPGGEAVPALGLGTWHMGENAREREREAAALRAGIDLGLALIDTAEMYGNGGAEEVVAAATAGRRDDVFIISKVLPQNASRRGTITACERSLKRLATDRIDLYLLHWRGDVPLAETVAAFEALTAAGKIRHWGVSNFDVADIDDIIAVAAGRGCASNQVLYHLGERGIEHDLVPRCAGLGMSMMAYSPMAQGRILNDAALAKVAARHGVPPSTVAVAWTLRIPGMISIPKTSSIERVRELARAAELRLEAADIDELDEAYPAPTRGAPLAML